MVLSARKLKPVVFVLALLPLAHLVLGFWLNRLGANPVEAITHGTGDWTLRLLLLTLGISSFRRVFGWRWLPGLRRMMGLFVWFYATLHLFTYLWMDQFFDWGEIYFDILERPYITVGMLAWLLLVPLGLTSNNLSMRKLGKNWSRLHKLVYPIAILGVLHYLWLVKVDVREPLIYGAVLVLLLGERVIHARRKNRAQRKSPGSSGASVLREARG